MKKFVCCALVLALLFGFAVPVSARELPALPASFDWALEYRVAGSEVPTEENTFWWAEPHSMEFEMGMSGTFVSHSLFAHSSYTEVSIDLMPFLEMLDLPQFALDFLLRISRFDLDEPFRIWTEVDFNDLNEPVFFTAIEIPSMVRLVLTVLEPQLARQYWVLDLSDLVAEAVEYFEIEIRRITDERRDEIFANVEEAVRDAIAVLREYIYEYGEELLADLTELITIHEFAFGHERLENGHSAYLIFSGTETGRMWISDFDLSFYAEITNINSAERVPMPELSDYNSVNLLELFSS